MAKPDFEKEYPNINLHQCFLSDFAYIYRCYGAEVARRFGEEIKNIAKIFKDIDNIDDLKTTIQNLSLGKTRLFPKPYKDAGYTNSDHLFYELRFFKAENDKPLAVIALFFPALFNNNDLKSFCHNWQTKKDRFDCIEFYKAVYYG